MRAMGEVDDGSEPHGGEADPDEISEAAQSEGKAVLFVDDILLAGTKNFLDGCVKDVCRQVA